MTVSVVGSRYSQGVWRFGAQVLRWPISVSGGFGLTRIGCEGEQGFLGFGRTKVFGFPLIVHLAVWNTVGPSRGPANPSRLNSLALKPRAICSGLSFGCASYALGYCRVV